MEVPDFFTPSWGQVTRLRRHDGLSGALACDSRHLTVEEHGQRPVGFSLAEVYKLSLNFGLRSRWLVAAS